METKNLVFMGTSVVEGTGLGVVVSTGPRTVMGKVATLASTTTKGYSTLRRHAFRLIIGLCIFGSIFALTLIIYWAAYLRTAYPSFMSLSGLIVTCIGMVVAFVPEGIPMALTLTLTVSARRMFRQNVLVKSLPTVETLGAIDVIASDKTGTLTQNKMSVMDVVIGLELLNHKACNHAYEQQNPTFLELIKCLGLCNRAVFDSAENVPTDQRAVMGDASDTGFLFFVENFMRVSTLRMQHPKLAEIPFNSKNKWMLTIVKAEQQPILMMKGASEIILERCTMYLDKAGQPQPMTNDVKDAILKHIDDLCNQGRRVLAAAQLHLDPKKFTAEYEYNTEERNFPMEGLTMVGLAALFDPPREDVPEAVRISRRAGIRVMMVTGDHHSTAASIAKMIGIISTDSVVRISNHTDFEKLNQEDPNCTRAVVIRGEDVPGFDKDQWKHILKHEEIVFARTTPEHKLIIVKECQRNRHVVAVTGDGVNDSPALKQANVGIAMGGGSDVAREAADIVLLDNRFSSIVIGIEYGRLVFDNLKKIITYLTPAGNWSEVIPVFVNAFLGVPLALSPFQMIVICILTDIAPSLSLIMEQPEGDLMLRQPYVKTGETLVDFKLFLHAFGFLGNLICLSGFFSFFTYMWVYAGLSPGMLFFSFDKYSAGYGGLTQEQLTNHLYTAQTVYFIALVMTQFGNLMTTRTRRLSFFQQVPFWGLTKNLFLLLGMIISSTLAIYVVYLPLIQQLFNTREPPTEFWFIPIGFGLLVFILDEIRKLIFRLLQYMCSSILQSKPDTKSWTNRTDVQ
jgi:sodium/potassium-transporting ATPase subunit alpha